MEHPGFLVKQVGMSEQSSPAEDDVSLRPVLRHSNARTIHDFLSRNKSYSKKEPDTQTGKNNIRMPTLHTTSSCERIVVIVAAFRRIVAI